MIVGVFGRMKDNIILFAAKKEGFQLMKKKKDARFYCPICRRNTRKSFRTRETSNFKRRSKF